MTNRELETRYMQMKLTWKNLVNANVELVDENKVLKEDNERLNNIINELEKYGKQRFNEYEAWKEECKNLCYINGITEILDKLHKLKGVDKE